MPESRLDHPAPDTAERVLSTRVQELQARLDAVQGRLRARHDVLLGLQDDAASLKDQYRRLQELAAEALKALKAAPPPPAPVLQTMSCGDTLRPRRSTRVWLPYATLALAGTAMMLGMPRLYARRAAPPPPEPAPEALRAVLPLDFSAREVPPPLQAQAPIDGEVSGREADAALKLVYDYVPPGSRRSVRELLQGQISAAAQSDEGSPWIIERADDGRFLVTLRPGADSASAPIYEFEVDPARRSVQPSQETQADLQVGTRLAARG